MKFKLSVFIIILCIFFGCNKCPDMFDMGLFELLESSKNLFPYDENDFKVVFRNIDGKEITGDVSREKLFPVSVSSTSRTCVHNEKKEVSLVADSEKLTQYISIPELDLGFQITFAARPNFNEYDRNLVNDIGMISITDAETIFPKFRPIPQLNIMIDIRNNDKNEFNYENPVGEIELNGKSFSKVYTNTYGEENAKFYYTHDLGVIGFKIAPDWDLYVFERFE